MSDTHADTSGILIDELDPAIRAAGRPVPARQRQWIARTEIPVGQGALRVVLPCSPKRPRRRCAKSSRRPRRGARNRRAQVRRPLRELHGRGERIEQLRREPARARCSTRSTRRIGPLVPRDRRAIRASRHERASSRCSSTTTPVTPSGTSCSSSRRASDCPTSPTTAKRSSRRSARCTSSSSRRSSGSRAWIRPDQRAKRIFDLETDIAKNHWDNVRLATARRPTTSNVERRRGRRGRARPQPHGLARRRRTPPRARSTRSCCASPVSRSRFRRSSPTRASRRGRTGWPGRSSARRAAI